MSWNGPINGDYTNVDFTKAPWAPGVMTLQHDECVYVIDTCNNIIEEGNGQTDTQYVVGKYNEIDWEKAINGDTYDVLKSYNPEINTQGINETGIVPELVEETPIEEVPQEEVPPSEVE